MRERTRRTAFRSVLRIYYAVGMIVAATAAGYIVAKKLNVQAGRQELAAFTLGIVGLMTALLSYLVVKIMNERETLRSQIYVDAHVFMRILAEWSNFEKLASLVMRVDTATRPTSARFLIHGLVDRGVLSAEDAQKLESALFVRNAVAHGNLSSISRAEVERAVSQVARIVAALTRVAGVAGDNPQLEPSLPLVG
jgi:hypothetical protein